MNSVYFLSVGSPAEVLRFGEMPSPRPTELEALVAVSARPVRPADLSFIRGTYRRAPVFPQIAGLEGVGVITSTAGGASARGQRVAFRGVGTWADLAVAPASRLYPAPDDIDDMLACQFALNPLTAFALLETGVVGPGHTVLVTAGSSQVARITAALGELRGANMVLMTRRLGGFEVGGMGQTTLSLAGTQEEAVAAAAGHYGPFDAVIDCVGGSIVPAALRNVRPGAHVVLYGVLDPGSFSLRAADYIYRNVTCVGFGIDWWLDHAAPSTLQAACDAGWGLIRARPELFSVRAQYPLARALDAIAMPGESTGGGTVVLTN